MVCWVRKLKVDNHYVYRSFYASLGNEKLWLLMNNFCAISLLL